MKKIILICIIAVISCTGVWFFKDKTLLRTSSGWKLYSTDCRELLDDNGELDTRIYSSFGLGRMKKLTRLEVESQDRYDFLEKLENLEVLNVNINEDHTIDISKFPEVRSLKELVIFDCDFTEICTENISDKMPELESLSFYSCHITDDNIRDISKCNKIKRIQIYGTDEKFYDLYPLTKMDNLEELYLEAYFPDFDLSPIAEMSKLKVLECAVYNDEDLKITTHLSSVQKLIIYSNSFFPNCGDDKPELPENYFDELESLEEFSAYSFTIGDKIDISSLPSNLKEMTFIDCNISENVKNKIAESGIRIKVKDSA
ncbi:hypothetical protein [Ruminococcus albus]|uniref:Leucine rich repeat-containing protein n=1 Tax=Ruminococcus albus TaxID=1264 RepID=A0A1H7PNR4_RUMAL|nr:hypothetical protein [Ruminococcus albus]SEL37034.1 hypothetical protein SAMN05216469_12320 [Ruminococcus albus]